MTSEMTSKRQKHIVPTWFNNHRGHREVMQSISATDKLLKVAWHFHFEVAIVNKKDTKD